MKGLAKFFKIILVSICMYKYKLQNQFTFARIIPISCNYDNYDNYDYRTFFMSPVRLI